MKGQRTGRESPLHRAADRIEQFVEDGQALVAIAAGLVLLVLQLPGFQDAAENLGLDSTRLNVAIGALLLTSILLELRHLKNQVKPATTGHQHYSDQNEMYNALIEKATELKDPAQKRIDVLGLTLYSAWPQLENFLERPGVGDWNVRLATLAADTSVARPWVPKNWPQESATTVAQVREFQNGAQRRPHNHTIEVYEYDLTPAVHGFRLGNGDVFVSTLRWWDNGKLGKHRFPYDYFPAHDISGEADAARALLASWFERAVRSDRESQGQQAVQTPEQTV